MDVPRRRALALGLALLLTAGPAVADHPLHRKQVRFAAMVGELLAYAAARGYPVTLGDAYRDPRCPYGHPKTLHGLRLAIDLVALGPDAPAAYADLGRRWKALGGAWGGDWGDFGHFSLPHGGIR